ncbi:MAG: hypothetical protein KKD05_04115 [Candidatus Omnitrophica bacterium]|nr:hypothetical protein [Candidatus Omnitrophota bacterium]
MAYNAELDKKLFSKEWENEMDKITVSVYAYNEGQKKLQISRNSRDKEGEYRFAKLGRMTKAEVQAILPFIQEAVSFME